MRAARSASLALAFVVLFGAGPANAGNIPVKIQLYTFYPNPARPRSVTL
jgi:hypothetical protein